MKKIIVSYDLQNDVNIMDFFMNEIDMETFPFQIIATSEDFRHATSQTILEVVKLCDLFIVLCGYQTDQSANVEHEFGVVQNADIPYMFVNGKNSMRVRMPKQANINDVIYSWNHQNIQLLYRKLF